MAKYDLEKQLRRQLFIKRVKFFLDNNKFVDMTDLTKRSVNFNSYMHLCLAAYAMYAGYSLNHVKQKIFKVIINPDTFVVQSANTETGEMYEEVRSTKELSTEELLLCMFNLKVHCDKVGFRLPEREDLMYLREIEEAAEQQKQFLQSKI